MFKSADPDYFISRRSDSHEGDPGEAVRLTGEASIWFRLPVERKPPRHHRADRGRVRDVGSEFVLACDMRFAALESAIFSQFEPAFGAIPAQAALNTRSPDGPRPRARGHVEREGLRRELAERYGWINRALPANEARRVRQIARASDRRVSRRWSGGGKDRVNATRSRRPRISVAISSSSPGASQPECPKPDSAAMKRGSRPVMGNGTGRDAGRLADVDPELRDAVERAMQMKTI